MVPHRAVKRDEAVGRAPRLVVLTTINIACMTGSVGEQQDLSTLAQAGKNNLFQEAQETPTLFFLEPGGLPGRCS